MNDQWMHKGKPFNPTLDEIKEKGWVGYVYVITHLETGTKYIGQKKLTKIVKLAPLKGKKLKRKETRFSDWPKYWSSSEKLKELHKRDGSAAFTREILHICAGKAIMNYIETFAQLHVNALFRDDYLNGIVNCRINTMQVIKHKDDVIAATAEVCNYLDGLPKCSSTFASEIPRN
jgi:hypothetical protein